MNKLRMPVKTRKIIGLLFRIFGISLRIFVRAFVGISFFLIIAVGLLCFTTAGSRLLWQSALTYVPGLSGKLVDGHLGRGFTLEGFKFDIPDVIHAEASYIDVSYNLLGVFSGELVVDNVEANNVLVVIGNKPEDLPPIADFLLKRLNCVSAYTTDLKNGDMVRFREIESDDTENIAPLLAEDVNPSEDSTDVATKLESSDGNIRIVDNKSNNVIGIDDYISSPIKLTLKRVVCHDFLLLSEYVDVAVSELLLKASLQEDTLYVYPSEASFIDVLLHNERLGPSSPNSISIPLKNPHDKSEQLERVAMLPTVFMPVKFDVESLVLNNVRYHQQGYDTGVGNITLQGSYIGSKISVSSLKVVHELGHAELVSSFIDLRDYYPISANLVAFSNNKQWFDLLNHHTLKASSKGDLADMFVNVKIDGKMKANITGSLGALLPSLPFELDAKLNDLSWPVLNPDYSAKSLNFKAKGSLDKIFVEANGKEIEALTYPSIKNLTTKFATDFNEVNIDSFNAENSTSLLDVTGKVNWSNGIDVEGKIKGHVNDLSLYLPQENGNINFDIATKLFYSKAKWSTSFDNFVVDGNFRGRPLKLKADALAINSDGKGNVKNLNFASGSSNTIDINGVMNGALNITGKVNLEDLAIIDPQATGELFGTFGIYGTKKNPVLALDFKSGIVGYKTWIINDLLLNADLTAANERLVNSKINVLIGQIRDERKTIGKDISLDFSGSEADHILDINGYIINDKFSTIVSGELTTDRNHYHGNLEKLKYDFKNLPIALTSNLEFSVDRFLNFNFGENHWSIANNIIDISNGFYNNHDAQVRVSASHFDVMKLKSFLPIGFKVTAPINFVADLGLNNKIPNANIVVSTKQGSIIYKKNVQTYDNIELIASLVRDEAKFGVNLDLGKSGSIKTNAIVGNPLADIRTLDGQLSINNIDLAILSKFIPNLSASNGILHGSGVYGGTLDKPTFNGSIEITDMNVNPVIDIGRIENINTVIRAYGTKADINSSFMLGGKLGSIIGSLDWENDLQAELKLNTDELPINFMGYGSGLVKLDVNAKFSPSVNSIFGSINIPTADIKVKNLPASSVSASNDVVEIRRSDDGSYKIKRNQSSPVELDFKIQIGPNVKINAIGLRTNLNGTLHVAQKPKKQMTVDGKINLVDGKFHAYGQNLIIESGRISFVGDVNNPSLNIRAIRDPHSMEDESITAGVLVTGSASNPNVKIFSKPQMSQSEALSYLLRGKGMDESSANSSDMSTQLLLGVGLMQTSGFISDLGEHFGLEDVALDSRGDGDETSVEVSAYILPKVQVAYGYGIYNSLSEFRLRYEMFPRFYIEGVSSLEQAIDAIYKFEFDF